MQQKQRLFFKLMTLGVGSNVKTVGHNAGGISRPEPVTSCPGQGSGPGDETRSLLGPLLPCRTGKSGIE